MKVVVYPADDQGCGYHRLIWPAQCLQASGYDVEIVMPENRAVKITLKNDEVIDATIPTDTDVIVFQRTTHRGILGLIDWCTKQGIATVIDVDDDLSCIHPSNPAAKAVNLKYIRSCVPDKKPPPKNVRHSWQFLEAASKRATMMQCTTQALVERYGRFRPARIVPNYIHETYFGFPRVDSEEIVWPASVHSHPNDPSAVGVSIGKLIAQGYHFSAISGAEGLSTAFGVKYPIPTIPSVSLSDWPKTLSEIGIGIVPLANTMFNRSKSWLKGLELSAVGVPWVASPRVEYENLHKLGAGILAKHPRDWYNELKALCDDKIKRDDLSAAGREVAAGLRLEDHAWRWWATWAEAYDTLHTRPGRTPVYV